MTDNTPVPVGVPQTPTKAQVGAIITAVGGILTALIASVPDNDKVQLWGGVVLGVLTVLANAYGVYQVPNKAKAVRNHQGAGEGKFVVMVALGVALGLLAWWIVASLGHNDHNGGRGNDWERHPAVALR